MSDILSQLSYSRHPDGQRRGSLSDAGNQRSMSDYFPDYASSFSGYPSSMHESYLNPYSSQVSSVISQQYPEDDVSTKTVPTSSL